MVIDFFLYELLGAASTFLPKDLFQVAGKHIHLFFNPSEVKAKENQPNRTFYLQNLIREYSIMEKKSFQKIIKQNRFEIIERFFCFLLLFAQLVLYLLI